MPYIFACAGGGVLRQMQSLPLAIVPLPDEDEEEEKVEEERGAGDMAHEGRTTVDTSSSSTAAAAAPSIASASSGGPGLGPEGVGSLPTDPAVSPLGSSSFPSPPGSAPTSTTPAWGAAAGGGGGSSGGGWRGRGRGLSISGANAGSIPVRPSMSSSTDLHGQGQQQQAQSLLSQPQPEVPSVSPARLEVSRWSRMHACLPSPYLLPHSPPSLRPSLAHTLYLPAGAGQYGGGQFSGLRAATRVLALPLSAGVRVRPPARAAVLGPPSAALQAAAARAARGADVHQQQVCV